MFFLLQNSKHAMPNVRFRDLTKSFHGHSVLANVDFSVRSGSIHAICGENGAGKSTLLKILGGSLISDSGEIEVDGGSVRFESPNDALSQGIATIHQELQLVPHLSIAENVSLGRLPARSGWLDRRAARETAIKALGRVGLSLDPDLPIRALSMAQRQLVEIARAIAGRPKVLACDEPTSSLSAPEAGTVFQVLRELRDSGATILYVSHRMNEIFELCDAATVLRDGRHVATFPTLEGMCADDLVSAMVGRNVEDAFGYRPRTLGLPSLVVRAPCGFQLTLRRGEIVGLFGLIGAGRTEFFKSLIGAGAKPAQLVISGTEHVVKSPRIALKCGLGFASEDRKQEGILPDLDVGENIVMGSRHRQRAPLIDRRRELALATDLMARLGVRANSPDQNIQRLSGGNQQKCILGRLLGADADVLLLDEPTRGIDVGAKSEIYRLLFDLAERNRAVLMVTSELPEAIGVCDRILVMNEGRIVADVPRTEANEERILRHALPVTG
jgi:L-arabinose transport system ATP-binding protein